MKTKTTNIIQRLCLFLFALVLTASAWATDYHCVGYSVFRSRNTVESMGKNKRIDIPLTEGKVEIIFTNCKTTSGTGSGAIYELAKGSRIIIKADDGYAIRWIILRDTEGGERYSTPNGIKRISSASGYDYYFEKEAISNSGISGANQNELNDDDNNIVVNEYDATEQTVFIDSHDNPKWGQFKVRDIIVGYVKIPNVRYEKEQYDIYSTLESFFDPNLKREGHVGHIEWELSNPNIVDISGIGCLRPKHLGKASLTATFSAYWECGKVQCKTIVNVIRDRVNFTAKDLPGVLFDTYDLHALIDKKTQSGQGFKWNNPGFSVTSSNSSVLRYDNGKLLLGGTAGEATITLKQEQNDLYEATTFSHTFIVARRDQYGTILIKDANEWKVFCKLVNEKGMTKLNARLEAEVDLGNNSMMVGTNNHKYAGTFDGAGYTLTVHVVGSGQGTAPFHRTNGATIKNLTIAGTVTAPASADNYHTAGLVGFSENTSLQNCIVEAAIHLGKTGDQYSGGLIGHILSGNTTIKDCAFIGSITGDNGNVSNIAGLIAWGDAGETIISNSYVNATYTKVSGLNPILRRHNGTTNNLNHVYYSEKSKGINPDYNKKGNLGEQVTAEQLRNGEVAYLLQNKRTENVWGQNLGSDDEPLLTADGAKRVYKVDFTFNSQVRATRYATHDKGIFGGLPTVQEILGTGYNPQHYYSGLTFADNFSGSTSVTADKQVAVSFTHKVVCEIASKADWKEFRDLVNGGQTKLNAKMTADVDLGSDIWQVGNHYAGTFDGQGHTLKINWNDTSGWLAPFYTVDGATIKNLRTEGEIKSSSHFLSGLVQSAYGNTTISGCVSAVNITSTYDNGGCDVAGMIECVRDNANVTITDCVVKGKFHATTEKGRRDMSGFIENQYGKCTLNNCLYIGENNATTTGGYTFAPNYSSGSTLTLNNCYYLNACGKAQGTRITADQLKNGEVAYLLQNKRAGNFWGQELGTDNEPQLTVDAAKHVYEVKFTYNNKVAATRYANSGKAIAGGMPTLTAKDLLGTGYNPHHYYTIAFAGGFNGSTTVNADRTVAINLTEKDCYEIASKDNWIEFSNIVYDGQNAVDAKMTADVDLGGDFKTIGGVHKYSGTFDGQGHTLTVNWAADNAGLKAPFSYVDGATIKNLRTKGKIQGNYGLAGLIYSVYGNTTVSDCVSEVDIKGAHGLAGMIYRVNSNAKVTMTDCVVKGDLTATTEDGKKQMVGFIYGIYGGNTLTNCLYIGTNNATAGNTFAFGANATNCYYLNACGRVQGTQVTEEQLKNGAVAYKLQNGRDTQFWGQTLGTDNEPRLIAFDNSAKKVYQVAFTYNNEVRATRYANSGKTVSLPTIKDFMGTGYNPHHYYTIAFAGGFNGSTTVNTDRTVAVTLTEKDCYDIASKEDWRAFRDLVNEGQTAVDAKLTQDVNLGEEILMLGYYLPNIYEGTFDGQGHTLSFNWTTPDNEKAPFKNVKNGTIRNLCVKGSITLTLKNPDDPRSRCSQASGLIHTAAGKTTISGCVIDVDLKAWDSLAGIVQWVEEPGDNVTITDCVVKGNFHATSTYEASTLKFTRGFVAHKHGNSYVTLNNCLYLGTNNVIGVKNSNTFCPDGYQLGDTGFTHIDNCYYLNACGEEQGTQITEAQLKNGEVAKLLQADRTDQCYWAQALGEEPAPYREADKAEANYVYYNKENNGWVCDDFRLTDAKPLPIGLDFIAARATYERTFAASGKATICLPYDLPVQGFKAYTLTFMVPQGNSNAVRFGRVNDRLEAYHPYLLTADGVPQLGGNNIQVKAFNREDLIAFARDDYAFMGTVDGVDNATAAADKAYILQNDGKFHLVTTGYPAATVPAYHAYIKRAEEHQEAKELSIILDGETTGIGSTTNEATDGKNGPVYDLQGRRVADRLDDAARHRLPAGVYIVGGRKVILK